MHDFFNKNIPVIFDKEEKFIYFPISKNSQTSIARNVIKERAIVKKDNINLWETYKNKNTNDKISFVIIRNPIDRILSTFFYFKKTGIISNETSINSFIESKIDTSERRFKKDIYANFNVWDRHLNPQHVSIIFKEKTIPRFVIPMNDYFENSMNLLFKKIDIKNKMVKKNTSSNEYQKIKAFKEISKINKQKIDNFYNKDFDIWDKYCLMTTKEVFYE